MSQFFVFLVFMGKYVGNYSLREFLYTVPRHFEGKNPDFFPCRTFFLKNLVTHERISVLFHLKYGGVFFWCSLIENLLTTITKCVSKSKVLFS